MKCLRWITCCISGNCLIALLASLGLQVVRAQENPPVTFDPTAQTSSDIVSKQISSEDPSSIPRSDSLAKTLPSALQKPLMLSDVPNTATNINEHSSAVLTQEPVVSPGSSRRILDWGIGVMVVVLVIVLISLKQLNATPLGKIPADVVDVLGQTTLGKGQVVHLVRFGPKTLLVSVGTSGCQTLAELGDLEATEAIVTACRHNRLNGRKNARLSVASLVNAKGRGEA